MRSYMVLALLMITSEKLSWVWWGKWKAVHMRRCVVSALHVIATNRVRPTCLITMGTLEHEFHFADTPKLTIIIFQIPIYSWKLTFVLHYRIFKEAGKDHNSLCALIHCIQNVKAMLCVSKMSIQCCVWTKCQYNAVYEPKKVFWY